MEGALIATGAGSQWVFNSGLGVSCEPWEVQGFGETIRAVAHTGDSLSVVPGQQHQYHLGPC